MWAAVGLDWSRGYREESAGSLMSRSQNSTQKTRSTIPQGESEVLDLRPIPRVWTIGSVSQW